MTSNAYVELRDNRAGNPRAYLSGHACRVQDIYIDSEIHGIAPTKLPRAIPSSRWPKCTPPSPTTSTIQKKSRPKYARTVISSGSEVETGPGPLERKLNGTEAQRDTVSPR